MGAWPEWSHSQILRPIGFRQQKGPSRSRWRNGDRPPACVGAFRWNALTPIDRPSVWPCRWHTPVASRTPTPCVSTKGAFAGASPPVPRHAAFGCMLGIHGSAPPAAEEAYPTTPSRDRRSRTEGLRGALLWRERWQVSGSLSPEKRLIAFPQERGTPLGRAAGRA